MLKKIKICFVLGSLNQGGAEKQFVELIKNIDKSRFDVTLCIYSRKEVFFQEIFKIKGINIHTRNWKFKISYFRLAELFFFLRRYFKENRFDLIQTMLRHNGVYIRIMTSSFYNNRIVSSIRTRFDKYDGFNLFLEKKLIKKSFSVANTVSSAESFKSQLNPKFHDRICTIYNGFDTSYFTPPKIIKDYKNLIKIGLVGRISKEKNFSQIVRVLPFLNENIEINIIGSKGNSYDELLSLINESNLSDRITIQEPTSDIKSFYHSIDLCLITSSLEGCPNVLFESLLCGNFNIININANTDNFIVDGYSGLVYDGSDNDLIKKINYFKQLYINKEHYYMINNGLNYSRSNFSIKKMVLQYENLYEHIINKFHYEKN